MYNNNARTRILYNTCLCINTHSQVQYTSFPQPWAVLYAASGVVSETLPKRTFATY